MGRRREVIISDIPSRIVGGFKPAMGVGRGWVAAEYECEAFRGTGLATGHASGAPELAIRLDLKGRYVLYLALGCGDSIRAWLDGERGFREFTCEHGAWRFQECRLHAADLTGRHLHVASVPAPRHGHHDLHCYLGYIRAVPDDHAPRQSARNLIATNDGYSWIALDGMESIRDVWKQFAPYRDSDWFRMLWCPCGADVTGNHWTRVGTVMPFDTTHAYRRCDREFIRTTQRILRGGGDILKTAVAAARDVGMEIQFYIRPEAFFAPFPYDGIFTSKFLAQHPEWRCRDERVGEILRMSYAFPQVQDHMLAYIQELMAYRPDGISFAFNRSLPMMICEAPVIEAFRRRHGRLPRLPEENESPQLLDVRYELLGAFLERVQRLLASNRMDFSCIVNYDNDRNLRLGLDIERFASRGLFESVCVAGPAVQSRFWKRIKAQGCIRVYSAIHYGHAEGTSAADPYNHQAQARAFKTVLDSGFDGAFGWDADSMHRNPYNWHVLRHGGNRRFLDHVLAGHPSFTPVMRPIRAIRGVRLGPYDPMASY